MILRPFSASHLRTLSFGAALAAVAVLGAVASSAAPRNVPRNADGIAGPRVDPTPAPPTVTLNTTYAFSSPAPTFGTNTDGANPSGLVRDSNGNFLGSAQRGGANAQGTLFRVGPDGAFTNLHDFAATTFDNTYQAYTNADGSRPATALVPDGLGNFYGTASQAGPTGGGVVYKLDASGGFTVVHSFLAINDDLVSDGGTTPDAPLVPDGLGNFYGTTTNGGNGSYGTIYRLGADGTSFNVLHEFVGTAEGISPYAALVPDGQGNFLGLTAEGGANNDGVIYQIAPGGTFTVLHNFSGTGSGGVNNDGGSPNVKMVTDGQGNFYGVTPFGGLTGQGLVFKFTTDGTLAGSVLTSLYNFSTPTYDPNLNRYTNVDGLNPQAALVYGLDGNLYGTTENGGAAGYGTIFEITPDGTFTLLYTFAGGNDGASPVTSLTQATTTDFYGTTPQTLSFAFAPGARGVPLPSMSGTVFHLNVVPAAGVLQFDTIGSATETSGFATVRVARTQGGTGAITVPFTTVDGTARAGTDYTAMSGTLSWADGDTTDKTITVPITDRGINTGNSVYLDVLLGKPTGGAVLAGTSDTALAFRLNILDSEAPTITSSTTASGQVGVAFSYQIVATASPTSYTASGLPTGLTLDGKTGLISGTPTSARTFTAVLTATNSAGSFSVSVTFTITAATIAVPAITSANSASAVVGSPFTYQITASNNPASFGTSTLPEGLNVNITTGLIAGTPTTAGSYTIRLFAANAGGTGVGTLTLAVTTSQSQPTLAITSPPDGITVVVGQQVPLAASITDPDSAITAVQFLVNGQAIGVTDGNGPFVATATAPAAGTYALSAVATDAAGRTFSGTVHVTVIDADPANPAPTVDLLTPVNARDIASDAQLTLTATADLPGTAALDHVSIYVNGQIIATFDALGNLVTRAHGGGGAGQPVRQASSNTPLSRLFSATYQMPGVDKILTMLVTATDKLQRTSVSSVSSFHSRVTTDRAPRVAFANASALARVLVGSLNAVNITGSDPDAGPSPASASVATVHRQDAASDATLAQLEYWINGQNVAKVANTGSLNYAFTPPAIGKYVFHAVATDGSGLASVSDPVILEADDAPPVVTAAVLGDGRARLGVENGKVAIRRTGDLSAALTVRYKVAGSAIKGVNYRAGALTGTAVIPAGATQVKLKIKPLDTPSLPLGSLTVAKVKLLPSLDGSYTLGTPPTAKIKIFDNE